MTTYDYRIGSCDACNQRSIAEYRCARVAELLLVRPVVISYFDQLLNEIIDNYANASEAHPQRKEFVN